MMTQQLSHLEPVFESCNKEKVKIEPFFNVLLSIWNRFFDPHRNEYFFDRNRSCFDAILYYYQSGGRIRKPPHVSLDIFFEEIQFFELGESAINSIKKEEGIFTDSDKKLLPKNEIKKKFWLLCEYPESSTIARLVAIISVFVIIISIVIFCLETMPQFKHYKLFKTSNNKTYAIEDEVPSLEDPFFIIESICILWFTMELLIRFLSSPSKFDFIKVKKHPSLILLWL